MQKFGNNSESFGTYVLQKIGAVNRKPVDFSVGATANQNQEIIDVFVRDIAKWADDYRFLERPISESPLLSQAGILDKLRPIQEQFNRKFNDDIVARVRRLQDLHFERVRKIFELPPEVVGLDPVHLFLQSMEIRNYLRTLPLIDRVQLVMGSDDPALLHAIDTAAPCLQLLPPDILARAKTFRVQRRRKNDLLQAEDERQALERITGYVKNVPGVCTFVNISPLLPGLPSTVYPDDMDGYASDELADVAIKQLQEDLIKQVLSAAEIASK
jgi:hypothetical protein